MHMIKSMAFLMILNSFVSCIPNNTKPSTIPPYFPKPSVDDVKNEYGKADFSEEDDWVVQQMEELTRSYTNFPSADALNTTISGALSGPVPICLEDGDAQLAQAEGRVGQPLHPAAVGARRLLASYFQSCSAVDKALDRSTPPARGVESLTSYGNQKGVAGGRLRRITDNEAYVSSNIFLQDLKDDPNYPGEQCIDATQRPPVYGYGSTAVPKNGELKIFQPGAGVARGSSPSAGIDCSAFISAALAAQGLKTSTTAAPYERLTTTGFSQRVSARNSCLGNAPVSPEDSIRPGDMINQAGSHIVMVDTVGEDPLGIKKHSAANSCHSITTRDFDFTYIHSGAIKNSYGPSRVKASMHDGGTMWNNMVLLARKLCVQKSRQDSSHRDSKSLGMSLSMSVIRHKSHEPDCVGQTRMKIEGEGCLEGCQNLDKDVRNEA